MHAHTCTCAHTHVNHDKHVGGHLQFLYMYILACTCGGMLPDTTHPLPLPQSQGSQITKNVIKLEQIEIIHFCLKIWDLCTFLHSYRLGFRCRCGRGVPSQIAFFTFGPKKVYIFCSCEPPGKIFLVFTLESDRPYLD